MRELLAGKVSENDLLELLVLRLSQAGYQVLEFACELLGVTDEEVEAVEAKLELDEEEVSVLSANNDRTTSVASK